MSAKNKKEKEPLVKKGKQRKEVLLIEDDQKLQSLLETVLEEAGFRVYVSSRGNEGLETARRLKPDLLVVDVFLPCLDGFSILRAIREDEDVEIKAMPVIVMTARAPMTEEMFLLEGASFFIRKPFDPSSLVSKALELAG